MIVYKVTCLVDQKSYIGFSGKSLEKRKSEHIADSKRGSQYYFHRAIRKHGKDTFVWEVLDEYETVEETKAAEIQMIREHNTLAPKGYNMTEGGEGILGLCETSRRQISEKAKTRWAKEEFKAKMVGESNPSKRPEVRRKLSEGKKGENNPMFGKRLNGDHRRKISQGLEGNTNRAGILHDEATKKRISKSLTGQKRSKATKHRMTVAMKKSWAKRKSK